MDPSQFRNLLSVANFISKALHTSPCGSSSNMTGFTRFKRFRRHTTGTWVGEKMNTFYPSHGIPNHARNKENTIPQLKSRDVWQPGLEMEPKRRLLLKTRRLSLRPQTGVPERRYGERFNGF